MTDMIELAQQLAVAVVVLAGGLAAQARWGDRSGATGATGATGPIGLTGASGPAALRDAGMCARHAEQISTLQQQRAADREALDGLRRSHERFRVEMDQHFERLYSVIDRWQRNGGSR